MRPYFQLLISKLEKLLAPKSKKSQIEVPPDSSLVNRSLYFAQKCHEIINENLNRPLYSLAKQVMLVLLLATSSEG